MRLQAYISILVAILLSQTLPAQTSEAPTKSAVMEQNEKLKRQIEKLRVESWQLRTQAEMHENELNAVRKEALLAKERELLEIAPAPEPEKNLPKSLWSNEVELGGAIARGNRNASQGIISFASKRTTENDNLQFRARGEIAREDSETKAQEARGTAEYRHDINKIYYWLLTASMEHDRISKLDYRGMAGPGVGQYFIRGENILLIGEAGPAYYVDRFENDTTNHSVRLRVAQEFWWRIVKPLRFFERAELLEDFDYAANRLINVEAGFESSITEQLCLRLTIRDRFQGMPVEDVQKNDINFITSVVWGF